jgi:opacity protein-like surface antigen
MKKNVLLLLTLLSSFVAVNAGAKEQPEKTIRPTKDNCCIDGMNFYAKVLGGANFLQSTSVDGNRATYQTGYIIDGSLGFCWPYGLRLEAEYAFRKNDIEKIRFFGQGSSEHGHLQTSSYMANLLWNLPLCSWGCAFWRLQPLVGAGAGYDFQQMHASNSRIAFNQKWHHFSWQAMVGLSYWLFCNTEFTLEYKFHQGGSDFNNHSIGVGLVYKFGFLKKCRNQAPSSTKSP